jgi:hypothetical protein
VVVNFHSLYGGGVNRVNRFNKLTVESLEALLLVKIVNWSESSLEREEEVLLLLSVISVDEGGIVVIESYIEL